MGVGVPTSEVISMASSIGCTHDSLPFSYLGLPVGKRMNLSASWNEVINRFRDKLSSWKAKSLSIGGRLTLVMAVLGSLPVYYFSLFKAPQKIINTLESIRSRFFWGFNDSQKASSEKILVFYVNGSGGSWWKKNALWRIVIKEFYGDDGGLDSSLNNIGVGAMLNLIGNLELSSSTPDRWEWACDKSGKFNTKFASIFRMLCLVHMPRITLTIGTHGSQEVRKRVSSTLSSSVLASIKFGGKYGVGGIWICPWSFPHFQ
ncbi:hypothetical protein Tco_0960922 [Tanacetum coccineum]